MKVSHLLRVGSLLFSASVRMAIEDRREFTAKVLERWRQSTLWQPNFLTARNSEPRIRERQSCFHNELALGKLSFPMERMQFEGQRTAIKSLIVRANQKRMILESLPAKSISKCSPRSRKLLRIGFFLTNSLPHTQSGYTLRSHKSLLALKPHTDLICAATRLAYPVLIGRIPRSSCECFQGISYARLLPTRYPRDLISRLEQSRDLVREWARLNDLDVMHTTTDYNNALVVSWVARELRIPWVYEVRGELENTWLSRIPAEQQEVARRSEFYQLARRQEAECMKAADAVVVLSYVSKQSMIERGVDPSKIHVVPNAVEARYIGIDFDREDIKSQLGLSPGKKIGSVSSIVRYEGFEDLLHAATHLPDCEVLLVGDGTDLPRLRKLALDLGIQERVIFAGKQPNEEIWKWYAALDVFVVPRKDTEVCRKVTPVKVLMAQGLGTPVVASDLPALREITGGLANYVEASSPRRLAQVIADVLVNHHDTRQSIEWAKSHTWEENAQKYIRIYKSILQESPD